MPTPRDTHDLARHLVRLARSGAYAAPASDDPAADYHVHSPRNDFAAPIATLKVATVACARDLGWVSCRPDGRLTLTRKGRQALLREITTPAKAPANQTARRAPPPAAPHPAALSARLPQRNEGPLAWLRSRKDRHGVPLITQPQFEAGERFASDYARAQMQARVTASWSAAAPCLRAQTPGAGSDITDAALAARDRFYRAVDVVGPKMGQFLIDVCCHDIGLEAAERTRRWPVRSGKVVLDMGLTTLARHYGLATGAPDGPPAQPSTPRPRRWADSGFVPSLDTWI